MTDQADRLTVHDAEISDLPLLPQPADVLTPEWDGDMAELECLAEVLCAAIAFTADVAPQLLPKLEPPLEWDVYLYLEPWPVDRAEKLLAAWKSERQAA